MAGKWHLLHHSIRFFLMPKVKEHPSLQDKKGFYGFNLQTPASLPRDLLKKYKALLNTHEPPIELALG